MKMVMVVFRDTLKDHMVMFLKERETKAYTLIHEVAGVGETGVATGSFAAPGSNSMILVVLPEKQADRLVEGLKEFRNGLTGDFPSGKVPLHAFVFQCMQAV
jgi:nitrogen regulatory protein PII